MEEKVFKNPVDQADGIMKDAQKVESVEPSSLEEKVQFNKDEQEERRKAKKRWISQGDPETVMKGWWFINGDPTGYYRKFPSYEDAYKYMTSEEKLEDNRRKKLIENYHNKDYPTEEFEAELMREFLGNKNQALKWLIQNGRKFQ